MIPQFDRDANLVGWYDGEEHVFDTNMDWVAFVASDNTWSASTENWLGPLNGSTFLDTDGKPVAWTEGHEPEGDAQAADPVTAFASTTSLEAPKTG